MPMTFLPRKVVIAGTVGLTVLAWWLGGRTQPIRAQQAEKPDLTKAVFYGVGACKECHTKPAAGRPTDFVRLDEYTIWRTEDKHSLAYAVLEGPRGQRMSELLKADVTKAETGCLSCHAMNFPKERQGQQFSIKDGVSCDGCHGPSQHWIGPHAFGGAMWRDQSAEQKEAQGMFDVRNPVKRAEMCNSCHVGSPAEGKVVSHAMYAAGHPPLPNFELANFSRNLPQHWWDLKNIPYLKNLQKENKSPDVLKRYHFDTADSQQTQLVMAGAAVALRDTMFQLALRSDLEGKSSGLLLGEIKSSWPPPWLRPTYNTTDRKKVWPELILGTPFGLSDNLADRWPEVMMTHSECSACHHELQTPSWRQMRGYPGKPGRPPAKAWPLALARVGGVASDADFKRVQQDLLAALDRQPFGEPGAIFEASSKFARWAGTQKHPTGFTRQQALDLLSPQAAAQANELPDFDSARQMAWAFEAIYEEWYPKDGPQKHPRDAEIRAILTKLQGELNLRAYSASREQRLKLVVEAAKGLTTKKEPTVAEFLDALPNMKSDDIRQALLNKTFLAAIQQLSDKDLAQTLDRAASYDPAAFMHQYAELANLVSLK
jgi:hypothetical protein